MRLALMLGAALFVAAVSPLTAGDRISVGTGRMFNNDMLGDGEDRWRTGSYTVSKLRARAHWDGERPTSFGDLIEYRFRGEIIAPAQLRKPDAGDRPYAGILSFGMHTHYQWHSADVSLGADMVVTGKQTGISGLQDILHDWLGAPRLSDSVIDNQIANGFHPTISGEIAQPYRISETATLRPYIEGRAGDETLLRVGADFTFGGVGQRDMLLRDVSTGQLYRGTNEQVGGLSFVVGGDIAKVFDSIYLPSADGYVLTESRNRLRAGMTYQQGTSAIFYGLTWLGKEFEAQSDDQVIGSLRVHWQF